MGTLAYVVSAHGFGHAARSAAIIGQLKRRRPSLDVHVLTTTPRWFFEQSLDAEITWHGVETDLGLVQATALEEDLESTLNRLEAHLDDPAGLVAPIRQRFQDLRPDLVVCDISPWGLEASRQLGLPSVLVENFTWDWIYRGYDHPRFERCAERMGRLFESPVHLRLEPFCGPLPGSARAVPPVARPRRSSREKVRRALGIPESEPLAMMTMGGVPWSFGDLERQLEARTSKRWLLIAGGADRFRRVGRVLLIPHRSDFYHPDLVGASEAVVGKLGYSTVAEVAEAGRSFLFVPRRRFAESPVLERWVREHLVSDRFEARDLEAEDWVHRLDDALDRLDGQAPRPPRGGGADVVAAELLAQLPLKPRRRSSAS